MPSDFRAALLAFLPASVHLPQMNSFCLRDQSFLLGGPLSPLWHASETREPPAALKPLPLSLMFFSFSAYEKRSGVFPFYAFGRADVIPSLDELEWIPAQLASWLQRDQTVRFCSSPFFPPA